MLLKTSYPASLLSFRDIRFPLCQPLHKALSLPPPASEPPIYILESNLETQQLWYLTAGKRPKQPRQEREYFEQQWQKNFEASKVHYDEPIDTIAAPSLSPYNSEHQTVENNNPPPQIGLSKRSRTKIDDNTHSSEFNGEVIFKGISPFSHSVSKSFNDYHVSFMTVHIPCYRIFRSYATKTLRAEFLVIISLGSPTPVTFGVWRRHSDFDKLVKRLQALNLRSGEDKIFKNSLLSWDCVLQRKRWFQCLEKEYLTLKTFLLERFMHDLLFESPSPNIISSFMGFREGH